jgi:hypothetical protein
MASTNYLTRILWKKHTANQADFKGAYEMLMPAKTVPAPVEAPNTVEITTLEDDAQTFLPGIKQSSSKEYVSNLDNEVINTVDGMDDEIDILILYGSDGLGQSGIYGYTCKRPTATPNETSGPDGVLEMTVTCVPMTVPEHITGTVTYDDSTKKFTLA